MFFVDKDVIRRFAEKVSVDSRTGCWTWNGGVNACGYGQFRLGSKMVYAHRLAWMIAFGDIPFPGAEVMHSCDNPSCVNPDHLMPGTHTDNMQDMAQKGRAKGKLSGEANGRATLTADQVADIRRAYELTKGSVSYIAKTFGISRGTAGNIIAGRTWK